MNMNMICDCCITTKNSFASANIRHFQGKNQVTNSAPDPENSRRR